MRDSYALYTDKLQGEYLEVFDRIQLYVNTFDIDDDTKEDQLGNLLDTFLIAQDENRSVYDFTGKNIAAFCKSFCAEFSFKNRVLYQLDQLKSYAWTVFIISLLILSDFFFDLSEGKDIDFWIYSGNFNITGYIFALMILGVISAGIHLLIRSIIARNKAISPKLIHLCILILFIPLVIFVFFIMDWDITNILPVPCWVLILISGVYLLLYYTLNHKRLSSRNKVKLLDTQEMKESIYKTVEEEMEKKYIKKNAKRTKKGMAELSMLEFIELEEKECNKMEKNKYFYFGFPVVLITIMCLFTEFEGFVDMLIFIAILSVLEYAIMGLFWKLTHSGIKHRRAWVVKKSEELSGT